MFTPSACFPKTDFEFSIDSEANVEVELLPPNIDFSEGAVYESSHTFSWLFSAKLSLYTFLPNTGFVLGMDREADAEIELAPPNIDFSAKGAVNVFSHADS